jgi:hypothetical protein
MLGGAHGHPSGRARAAGALSPGQTAGSAHRPTVPELSAPARPSRYGRGVNPRRPTSRAQIEMAAARRRRKQQVVLITTGSVLAVLAVVGMFVGRGWLQGSPSALGPRLPTTSPPDGEASPVLDLAIERVPPVITIRGDDIELDERPVAKVSEVVSRGRTVRVDGLYMALKERRSADGVLGHRALLDADQDTPSVVVKSVFQTAAHAGYGDVQFVVR